MECRQCTSFPTGHLEREAAVEHLVAKHPGRAVVFTLKLRLDVDSGRDFIDFDAELERSLGHRSEFNDGVYE